SFGFSCFQSSFFGRSVFRRRFLRPRQVGDNALRGSGSERLCDGLLATAPTAATASTSALAFTTSGRTRLPDSARRFLARGLRFKLGFRGCRNFCLIRTRLVTPRFNVSWRCRCARDLLRIEISRLQWRRRRLTSLLRGFLLAALQSIFHPFTHVQACNT